MTAVAPDHRRGSARWKCRQRPAGALLGSPPPSGGDAPAGDCRLAKERWTAPACRHSHCVATGPTPIACTDAPRCRCHASSALPQVPRHQVASQARRIHRGRRSIATRITANETDVPGTPRRQRRTPRQRDRRTKQGRYGSAHCGRRMGAPSIAVRHRIDLEQRAADAAYRAYHFRLGSGSRSFFKASTRSAALPLFSLALFTTSIFTSLSFLMAWRKFPTLVFSRFSLSSIALDD